MASHCNRSRDESAIATTVNEGNGQSNLIVPSADESDGCEEDNISVEVSSSSDSTSCTQSVKDLDIGKLLEENIDFKALSREQLLTHKPNPNASVYPHTRGQPSWLKNHPWLHYSWFTDGVFCRACAFFLTDNPSGCSAS